MYCTFVVQICYNSWHGMSILFSDFLGDIDELTPNCLRKAAATILREDITTVVFYVPKGTLSNQMKELKADNITAQEQWNVASMSIEKIRSVISI